MQDKTLEANPGAPAPALAHSLSTAFIIVFVLFTYWMYGYRPITSYPQSAVDDGLYLRHANAFVNWICGRHPLWLGDYDCFLFAKSPLYGVFLGILNLLCLPVRVGEFILLIGLPFFFSAACRPLIRVGGVLFFLTAALLTWMPILPSDTHLQRMAFQCILSSYLTVASIGLTLRWKHSFSEQCRWAALTGLAFSLCYLNREEAASIGLLVLFSLFLFCLMSKLGNQFNWRRCALVGVLVALCAVPLISLVSFLNYRSYGVFQTTMRRSTAFTAAYQRLTSLEPENHKRYIPITRSTRFRAYDLSPTFGKFKPIMEGHGTYWVAGIDDHSALNGYSAADNEFFVSNYEFALEYAASVCGGTNAVETERIFAAIERELTAAVSAGKIQAGRHGPAILAAPVPGDFGRIAKGWRMSLLGLLQMRAMGLFWQEKSVGTEQELRKVSLFVHSSLEPEATEGIHYQLRVRLVGIINRVLQWIYWATIPLTLIVLVLSYIKSRIAFWNGIITATIPLLGLALFCLTMAVVDTLGFPFLVNVSYNSMGYSPLSDLSAFALVIAFALFANLRAKTKAV